MNREELGEKWPAGGRGGRKVREGGGEAGREEKRRLGRNR
jgi:hypothetical protein